MARKSDETPDDGAMVWKPADYDWMDKPEPRYEDDPDGPKPPAVAPDTLPR